MTPQYKYCLTFAVKLLYTFKLPKYNDCVYIYLRPPEIKITEQSSKFILVSFTPDQFGFRIKMGDYTQKLDGVEALNTRFQILVNQIKLLKPNTMAISTQHRLSTIGGSYHDTKINKMFDQIYSKIAKNLSLTVKEAFLE